MRFRRTISGGVAKIGLIFATLTAHTADEPQVYTPTPSLFENATRLTKFLETLHERYVDPSIIYSNQHMTAALRAYLRSVDPTADFLAPDEAAVARTAAADTMGDVGLRFTMRNGYPTVIAPLAGTPAQRAGVLAGDVIRAVDGLPVNQPGYFEFARRLRGPVGSKLGLTILDPVSGQRHDVTLVRAGQTPPSSPAFKFLAGGIAYTRLSEFSEQAVRTLQQELQRIEPQHPQGLILDLRNNPGGDPQNTQVAAQLFVRANTEIVTLVYPRPTRQATLGTDQGQPFTAPVVLLVNGGTAAEAEVFAATLRDHKRARLVGSQTFGCGQHYEQVPLPDGAALYLPVATFVPPAGKPFQGTGLTPDVVVNLPRDEERKLATTGFGAFNWIDDKTATLAGDRPLAKALELLMK